MYMHPTTISLKITWNLKHGMVYRYLTQAKFRVLLILWFSFNNDLIRQRVSIPLPSYILKYLTLLLLFLISSLTYAQRVGVNPFFSSMENSVFIMKSLLITHAHT